MSSTGRSRREAAETMRRQEAAAARRRRVLTASAVVGAVVVVIAALVIVKLVHGGSSSTSTAAPSGAASSQGAVVDAVTSVPESTLAAVGAGTVNGAPTPIKAPPLTQEGKPKILYVGAEYCPFCAAERWGVAVALSRFGTWSGLGTTTSAADDVFPSTPTLSFHGATLKSDYVSFTGVETSTNQRQGQGYAPLDQLSPADEKILQTYDTPQYVQAGAGSIPFIDIAGAYVQAGSSFSPQVLAGMTAQEVASKLADPSSEVAKTVDGTANVFTAAVCKVTKGQPTKVCTAPGVVAAASKLAAG